MSTEQLLQKIGENPDRTPRHVGMILDGNRRWAAANKLAFAQGYELGAERADQLCHWALQAGVEVLSLWTWSMENFQRDSVQQEFMMALFRRYLTKALKDDFMIENEVCFKAIGRIDLMPEDIQELVKKVEERTAGFSRLTLYGCIAYGGRQEIVDATTRIVQDVSSGALSADAIDAELISQYVYPLKCPPDLIIRTGGDNRTSGFLLWHADYAEWYFSEKLFPDFDQHDFLQAIVDYQQRDRRFGR